MRDVRGMGMPPLALHGRCLIHFIVARCHECGDFAAGHRRLALPIARRRPLSPPMLACCVESTKRRLPRS